MAELRNCPKCNSIFNYNGIREICSKCAADEEKMYETVYRFLRKRENRSATVQQIVKVTGVEEELLHKWVRKGRLQTALFPNLGYPCENCGELTQSGTICEACQKELKGELQKFDAAVEFRESVQKQSRGTYLVDKKELK